MRMIVNNDIWYQYSNSLCQVRPVQLAFGKQTRMLKLAVLSFLFLVAYGAYYEEIVARTIKEHGRRKSSFKPGYNEYLRGKSAEQMKRLMGVKKDTRGRSKAPEKVYQPWELANLPASFTAGVDMWTKCASTIGFIKDQADCGSCWAVAASEVIADRICIANYASIPPESMSLNENTPAVDMSAEQIMGCCKFCGDGCAGGYPIDAMRYWAYVGVVTGGWYGSNCGCQPYLLPPCGTSGCNGPMAETPACSSSCRHGFSRSFAQDKHMGTDHYTLPNNIVQIQQEIYNNGPVECAFDVYDNFMTYTSGVYDHTTGQYLGGHAIKIVGWGTDSDSGEDYWLVNNSWNVTWGLNGKVKFIRGRNLAGIEDGCVAGMAKASDSNYLLTC